MDAHALHQLTAAYALDALDEREEREYEQHLARCPSCRDELTSLSEAASSLAYATDAPAPPTALRERILDQARAERPNVVPLRRHWFVPAVSAAAAVAAVVAVGLGIWAASLASDLDGERAARARDERAMAVLADPQARRIPLKGERGTLVVSRTGQAALVVVGLGRAPEGKTYEAWVIEGGKPARAGIFAGGEGALAVPLRGPVPDGATVAVTLERKGGVNQPTGTPLFSAET
jgi:anti-sigma factor RsiW